MSRRYLVHEFAAHAGVTVKALHLYDRLGLLVPVRSEAGHRLYTTTDFTRVRHIVALKRLGIPLRSVSRVLAASSAQLNTLLRQQQRVLDHRRHALDGLIRAVEHAEGASAGRSPSAILDSLVESLTMQDHIDAMRKYYPSQAWPVARQYYEQWPSDAWRRLHRDVIQALDDDRALDPASDIAQSFATRWLALEAEDAATPGVRLGHGRARADRRHWPEALQVRLAERERGRVARFVAASLWERWDAERVTRERDGGVCAHVSEARRRLYNDGTALLGRAPSSSDAQDLRARWEAIIDNETGGDSGMKAEIMDAFKARHRWPTGLVRSVAASYGLDAETWSAVADLIDAAHDDTLSGALAGH